MELVAKRGPAKRAQQNAASRTSRLATLPPDEQCYFLYCRGNTMQEIGIILGIDRNTVSRRIKKVAATLRATDEEKENWVAESVESFRQVKLAAWEALDDSNDTYLLTVVTAAEERIAKVRGLMSEQKIKHEVSGPNGDPIGFRLVDAGAILAKIASGSEADS